MRLNSYRFAAVLLLLILLGQVPAQLPIDQQSGTTPHYVVDAAWPRKPDQFKWGQMPGIAVDTQDQVYIFTRSQPAVQVYQADGTFLRAWNIEDFDGAHYIRIGPDGNVWTANIKNHVVRKYSPDGKLLLTLGEVGHAGDDQGHFDKPTDMAVLPTGDIFVSDGYGNRRIIHFDATGKYVNQWGEAGSKPGQFAVPHSIVADSHGRLYVADRENARIQVFDTKGKLLAVWANIVTPW
jgi:DNA-binding beta-propeller fold protein YncE